MTQPLPIVQLGDAHFHIEVRGNFETKDATDYVPSADSEHLYVNLPSYGGPLDLLLHLIKKHSMDIFDIPIMLITEKYLEALEEMRNFNLDIAGEFLLMAATLAEIKSKLLLPPDESAQSEDDEEGVDPRAELVRRLLEYQMFKEVAASLEARGYLGANTFARSDFEQIAAAREFLGDDVETPIMHVEAFELITLFAKALERATPSIQHAITLERISIRARINELIDFVKSKGSFHFFEALEHFQAVHKSDVIVTFLAVLEMARLKLLRIEQEIGSQDIILHAKYDNLQATDDEMLLDLDDTLLPN